MYCRCHESLTTPTKTTNNKWKLDSWAPCQPFEWASQQRRSKRTVLMCFSAQTPVRPSGYSLMCACTSIYTDLRPMSLRRPLVAHRLFAARPWQNISFGSTQPSAYEPHGTSIELSRITRRKKPASFLSVRPDSHCLIFFHDVAQRPRLSCVHGTTMLNRLRTECIESRYWDGSSIGKIKE